MEESEKTLKAAQWFAKSFDFDIVEYAGQYKGYVAYYLSNESLRGTTYGIPNYCLVREDYRCRLTTPDESLEIIALQK